MIKLTPGRIVRYALTAVVVVLLVMFVRTVDWASAWTSMRSASLPLLAAAIVVNFLSLLARGVRWWILLRAAGSPSLGLALRAAVAGAGLNNVLVANGGEAARIVFVTRATGVPSSKVLATAALDRIFDPIGFVAMLAWGAVAFHVPPEMERLRVPALAALALIVVGLVWLTLRTVAAPPEHVPERRAVPRGLRGRIRAWTAEFMTNLHHLATGPRIIWIVILTLLAWLGQLATFAFAAAAAHVPLSIAGNLATLLAVNIVGVVRATPGNVGVFQGAYALTAKFFGVAYDPAVAVSLLIQAIQIIPVTLIGIALAPEFLLKKQDRSALSEPPTTV